MRVYCAWAPPRRLSICLIVELVARAQYAPCAGYKSSRKLNGNGKGVYSMGVGNSYGRISVVVYTRSHYSGNLLSTLADHLPTDKISVVEVL